MAAAHCAIADLKPVHCDRHRNARSSGLEIEPSDLRRFGDDVTRGRCRR